MNQTKMDVARRLQKQLDERGISGNRLAKISGVSQSAVSAYLRSQKSPNVTNLKIICDALGITLSEFFQDDGDLTTEAMEAKKPLPPAARREMDNILRFAQSYIYKKYGLNES